MCDHVTPDLLQTFKVKWSMVKVTVSSDRQIIAVFWEIRVAEPNGDVIILIESQEIAVYSAHATGATSNSLKLQCIRTCHVFQSQYFVGASLTGGLQFWVVTDTRASGISAVIDVRY